MGYDEHHDLTELTTAVRAIAHGSISGPTGLEAVTMAIAGEGHPGHDNLAQAVRDAGDAIAAGLQAIAEQMRNAR